MRKIIFALLVGTSSQIFAQKSFFGIDAGVNVANQRMEIPYNYSSSLPLANTTLIWYHKNSVKPTFGFFFQYDLLEKLSFRVNPQYLRLGYKDTNFPVTDNLDIDYLTIPLTIRYNPTNHLSIGAGPYLSFTLGGTRIYNQDITKTYHKNDFGLVIGAEHDIYKNFAFGVNYFIGTKNIWLADQNGTVKYTNRALQLTLIYKFKKPS